jgi:hypothetical protein
VRAAPAGDFIDSRQELFVTTKLDSAFLEKNSLLDVDGPALCAISTGS